MATLVDDPRSGPLKVVAKVRVLFADTDAMGVVYHGAYLPWLEHGRVELLRGTGLVYRQVADAGWGLPVIEAGLRYLTPARYDDQVTVRVGISHLTPARVHFRYWLTVEPGDRAGETQGLSILWGETRHACVRASDGRPVRFPPQVYDELRTCYTQP